MLNIPQEQPLSERIDEMLDYISCHREYIENNCEALEIYEGDLKDKVLSILYSTLSNEYYKTIKDRVIPINFMPKMIDKMAQVYSVAPKRLCPYNQDFIDSYEKYFDLDSEMSLADEYANLFKGYALEPFVSSEGKPSIRAIPFNEFIVMGGDLRDRKKKTVFIKFMGEYRKICFDDKKKKETIKNCMWYIAYTDTEVVAFDADKLHMNEITKDINGVNEIGKIPFIYGNRSKQRLLPTQDTDLVQMIKMFPVLFTDLGGAIMYQCFTIMYGIDVDTDQIKMSPNAFWDFKSDKTSDKKPTIGTITPEAQVEKVLSFISHIMGAWAESKNIKVGSIGKLDGENVASGVSKIVDNMDTYEVRKKNIPFFRKEERELWYLLTLMNNHWVDTGEVDTELYPISKVEPVAFIKDFTIDFEPPKPMEDRSEVVTGQIDEYKNRFTTRRRAIGRINPEMTDKEIEELIKDIDDEELENEPEIVNNDEIDTNINQDEKEINGKQEQQSEE